MIRRKRGEVGESTGEPVEIVWTARARRDLIEIGDFIARDKPGAASSWVRLLIDAVENAARMPFAGRVVPELGQPDVREVIRRNYRIVYRARERQIVMLTVFDGRRLMENAINET
jgi:plasmid stabilization system protein ParE